MAQVVFTQLPFLLRGKLKFSNESAMPKFSTKKNHLKFIAILSSVAVCNYFSGCLNDNDSPPPPAAAGVYVAGFETGIPVATYFKNGTPVSFTDGLNSSATSITVTGNDVYAA